MNKFKSYFIGVVIAMAFVLCAAWFKGGVEPAKTVGIFFLGWVAGATSMFIKARLVYKS
jgi:hypothetical protein